MIIFLEFLIRLFLFTIKKIFQFIFVICIGLIILITIAVLSVEKKETVVSSKPKYVALRFPFGINEERGNVPSSILDFKFNETSYYDLLTSIEKIAEDNDIKGVIIETDNCYISKVHIEEINQKLEKIRTAGKKIYAYGTYMNNHLYRAALMADEIIMPSSASAIIDITGYYKSFSYLKRFEEKIGVKFNVIHIGEYKSLGEEHVRESMSEGLKSELTRLYDKNYNSFIDEIAKKRSIDKVLLDKQIENGILMAMNAKKAKEYNLIDDTMFFNELLKKIGINNYEKETIDIYGYANLKKISSGFELKKDKIALIYAEGDIMMGAAYNPFFNKVNFIIPAKLIRNIQKAYSDEKVKGIVIRINSNGGSSLASEAIYDYISKMKIKNKKPLYFSMGDVSASGGYYISSVADKIFANKSTVTGSIGVVSVIPSFSGLNQKLDIKIDEIKKGKYSDMYELKKEIDVGNLEKMRFSMEEIYLEFKDRIKAVRNIEEEKLENIAQGKIWLGDEAKEVNLVDEIGTIDDTIKDIALKLELKEYSVEIFSEKINYFEYIKNGYFAGKFESLLFIQDMYQLYENDRIRQDYSSYFMKPLLLMPVDIEL